MRLTTRRADDADLIRARLRVLLAEPVAVPGWLPDDEDDEAEDDGEADEAEDDGEDDEEADRARESLPPPVGRHRSAGRERRWDPGRRGAWSMWAAGVLAALVVVAWTWLDRPRVEPVTDPAGVSSASSTEGSPGASSGSSGSGAAHGTPRPAGTPTSPPATPAVGAVADVSPTVVVSVVGKVASPGLVTLPVGSRVADAVAAVGGLLPDADPASVNLAAVVTDGQQVAVGVPGAAGAAPGTATPAPAGAGGAAPGTPLDLNSATVADLDALPGVGPVLAQRIVDHRTQHGRFTSVDQLDDVPGIGPAIFAQLAPMVRV